MADYVLEGGISLGAREVEARREVSTKALALRALGEELKHLAEWFTSQGWVEGKRLQLLAADWSRSGGLRWV